MRPFHEVAGKPLEWVRVGTRRERAFEMATRGEVVAGLDYRTRLGGDADGEAADGMWSFERRGVIRSPVEILGPDGEKAGEIRPGGILRPTTLELGDATLTWKGVGAFPRWQAVNDDRGSTIVRCRALGVPAAGRGLMQIEPPGFGRPDLSLVCMAAWYLVTRDQGQYAG